MEDVEAWQAVDKQTVNALVDRLSCLSANYARIFFDKAIEGGSVPLERLHICLGARQVTVEPALVALQEPSIGRNLARVDGQDFLDRVTLDRVETKACLLVADGAVRLAILVLSALVAQLKVVRENELLVGVQVHLVFDILVTKERLCGTLGAFEALWALPVALRNLDELRLQAPEVVHFIADGTDQQALPLLARMALLTEHAVVAAPVVLELGSTVLRVGQTVRVEALGAQVAGEEVIVVAEGAAEIAHLFEDQSWVFKADLYRVGVPARVSFVVRRQVFHQLLPLLVGWQFALFRNLAVQVFDICELEHAVNGWARAVLRHRAACLRNPVEDCAGDAKDAEVRNLTALQHLFGSNFESCCSFGSFGATGNDALAQVLGNVAHLERELILVPCRSTVDLDDLDKLAILQEGVCLLVQLGRLVVDLRRVVIRLRVYKNAAQISPEMLRVRQVALVRTNISLDP